MLIACGESCRVVGERELASRETRGRLDVDTDVDDCRRFDGGERGSSGSGRMTAEAIGLHDVSD